MKLLITILLLAFAFTSRAQNGINYKAVVKDNLGNIVANSTIDVRFTITRFNSGAILYREIHTPTTDANGIIIVNIGEGTFVTGSYSTIADIEWGIDQHFLGVEIDTGSGYVDLGSTQFMAVPYAFNAEIANNVSGLEYINEGSGTGWRLIGQNPSYYGNVGFQAVDLSISNTSSSTYGATGSSSFASGYLTTAAGVYSSAMGAFSRASGYLSFAVGSYTLAESSQSTAFGRYNVGGGSSISWVDTDSLFEIGNGSSNNNRSNAFTVLKNGNIGIGTHTPDYPLSVSGSLNLNEGLSGSRVAIRVNGDEALWYNGTYFSWGFGGTANYFSDAIGIGDSTPDAALDVVGNIHYTGTITDVSDKRLKENFKDIDNALELIQKVSGYSYNMKEDETKKREYGVIAQEIQNVFPEMVTVVDNDKGYLGVSYIQLIPVLLEAIKEQQQEIKTLKDKLEKYKLLEARIKALEQGVNN